MAWKWIAAVFALAVGPAAAVIADDLSGGDEKREGRLKFRNGPPCTCATGLDESAISEASKKWEKVVTGKDAEQRRKGDK